MNFSYRIKQAREEKGLTRKDLAKIIGVTSNAISNYENNISSPKEEIMLKLFDALEVDPNFLFQDSFKLSEPLTNSPNIKKLLEKYDRLNILGQEEAVKRVEDLTYVDKYKKDDEPKLYRMVAESGNLILPMTDKIKKQLIENAKNAPDVSKDLDY